MDVPGSNAASTSHTVTDLTNGVLYTFKVRGVNPAGPGEPSNEASATPFSLEGAPPADRAHKARKQTVAATSRALLGMAAATLGERLECDPVTHHDNGSIADQTLHIVKELLGINGAALPTDLNLEALGERLLSQSFQIAPSTTTRGEGNGEERCPFHQQVAGRRSPLLQQRRERLFPPQNRWFRGRGQDGNPPHHLLSLRGCATQ